MTAEPKKRRTLVNRRLIRPSGFEPLAFGSGGQFQAWQQPTLAKKIFLTAVMMAPHLMAYAIIGTMVSRCITAFSGVGRLPPYSLGITSAIGARTPIHPPASVS